MSLVVVFHYLFYLHIFIDSVLGRIYGTVIKVTVNYKIGILIKCFCSNLNSILLFRNDKCVEYLGNQFQTLVGWETVRLAST